MRADGLARSHSAPLRALYFYSVDPHSNASDAHLSGTVTQNGAPVVRTVRAYDRASGLLIGQTTSGADGSFSILARHYRGPCYVLALDDLTQAPDYNAEIFDLVTPV